MLAYPEDTGRLKSGRSNETEGWPPTLLTELTENVPEYFGGVFAWTPY